MGTPVCFRPHAYDFRGSGGGWGHANYGMRSGDRDSHTRQWAPNPGARPGSKLVPNPRQRLSRWGNKICTPNPNSVATKVKKCCCTVPNQPERKMGALQHRLNKFNYSGLKQIRYAIHCVLNTRKIIENPAIPAKTITVQWT